MFLMGRSHATKIDSKIKPNDSIVPYSTLDAQQCHIILKVKCGAAGLPSGVGPHAPHTFGFLFMQWF